MASNGLDTKAERPKNEFDLDAVVIGGGFGGCYMLYHLRQNGFKTVLLEAASSLGGVWAWNRYPGARVDCEFPFYGFSDPKIWSDFQWTERFPGHAELRRYFQHVADVWDLHPDARLNTHVTGAVWVDGLPGWEVKTARGDVYRCKWLIAATGTSFKHHIPDWKGLDKFQGVIHHSAHWPEKDLALQGKRIAVIGAGSTGVQVVQEVGEDANTQVTQFIRTPNYAIPMRQRTVAPDEIYAAKPYLHHVFKACRNTRGGLPIENSGKKVFDETAESRQARYDEQWKRGGFNVANGLYTDHLTDRSANREVYDLWCKKTRERIRDPGKRELLAPLEPPYYIGTKRPSLEQNYYEICDQENVEITDSPIVEFTATGIKTQDGTERNFDVVAICTGYDAVTGGLQTMGIKGRQGLDLQDKWAEGVVTNLGILVNGYPNFFMVYGPQAPTSLTNGPVFLEIQCDWILQVLIQQRREGLSTIEADRTAEQSWRSHVLGLAEQTLMVHTDSWYMGANIPGKRREYLVYMGGIPLYKQKLAEALEGWKGIEVHAEQGKAGVQG